MAKLGFISSQALEACVMELLRSTKAGMEKAEKSPDRNVIDPFTALFEMAFLDSGKSSWIKDERRRQAQKSLTNAIGRFHQQVLGSVKGWKDLKNTLQVDLANDQRRIIAEIKNKHNTLKASDQAALYGKLRDLINPKASKFHGFTAYYVEIIPAGGKQYDVPFTPSDNATGKKCPENPQIRKIDGRSFYALATGEDDALDKLFESIPAAIGKKGKSGLAPSDFDFALSYYHKAYFG